MALCAGRGGGGGLLKDSRIDSQFVITFIGEDYTQLYIFSVGFGILKKIEIVFVVNWRGIMKKIIMFVFFVITINFFSGCSKYDDNPAGGLSEENGQSSDVKKQRETEKQLVMIDGKLYYNTRKENTITRKCGTMDGKINSAVDNYMIPKEDNQSNFGKGYGYQVGVQEGEIDLFIDDKWIVFELLENGTD